MTRWTQYQTRDTNETVVAREMKLPILLPLVTAVLLLTSCIIDTPTPASSPTPEPAITATPVVGLPNTPTPQVVVQGTRTFKQYSRPPLMTINPNSTFTANIRTNKGNITMELFAAESPVTVNNFVFLAREGFYDGVIFHRVIRDFMIQTGDPTGTGGGGPGYRFQDEPVTRSYSQGTVAMANAGPNTNGSQFFIVHGPNVGLDPKYTIFGQVTEGLSTVDTLANTPVTASMQGELSVPTEVLRIETIEITEGE